MKALIPKGLRKFPHVAEHNWLTHFYMVNFLTDAAETHARGLLADIGCGRKPWQIIFKPFVSQHLGIDMQNTLHGTDEVDIIGSAYETGLSDGQVDTVLCTEVLEHLEEPQAAVNEMHRILAPGGVVILTVPFFWHLHEEPRDFYRYTSFGLQYLFEKGGFEIVEIRPLTGFIVTFAQLLAYYNFRFARGKILRVTVRLINWWIQKSAQTLNHFDKTYNFSCLYGLVARKNNAMPETERL